MLLCLLFLSALISLPQVDSPFSLTLKAQPISPSLDFQIVPQHESIIINDISLSVLGRAFFFLSTTLNHNMIPELLQNTHSFGGNSYNTILDLYGKPESLTISGLESDTQYYLYSFAEDYETKVKSVIKVQVINTLVKTGPLLLKEYVSEQINSTISIFSIYYEVFISALPSMLLVIVMCLVFRNLDYISDPMVNTKTVETYSSKLDSLTSYIAYNTQKNIEEGTTEPYPSSLLGLYNSSKNISQDSVKHTCKGNCGLEDAIDALEDENQGYRDQRMCGICCERPREIIFLNCGHLYCCLNCSIRLPFCPLDQQLITAKVRFRSYIQQDTVNQITASLMSNTPEMNSLYTPFNMIMKSMKLQLSASEKLLLLKAQNENYKYLHNCVVCGVRPKDCLFFGCCHIMCCHQCAEGMDLCPFDKKHIISKIRVYLP